MIDAGLRILRWRPLVLVVLIVTLTGIGSAVAPGQLRGHLHQSSPRPPADLARIAIAAQRNALQAHQRELDSSRFRALRQESRTRFRHLGGRAAISVARRVFAIGKVARQPLTLERGSRVLRTLGGYAAIVKGPSGRRHLARSTQLLAVGHGRQAKLVALNLVRHAGFLSPAASPFPLRIRTTLANGVEIPGGISLRSAGSGTSRAAVVGNRAFFANTSPDTDFSVEPLAVGFETFWYLRSPSSPQDETLQFSLPAGAGLRPSKRFPGGAELLDRATQLYAIPPPAARDANGTPVPAYFTVSRDRLTVHVAHDGGRFRYPIEVDPLFFGLRAEGGIRAPNGTWTGWAPSRYNTSGASSYFQFGGAANSWLGGGSTNAPAGYYGLSAFSTPGSSYVYRVDFAGVYSYGVPASYLYTSFYPSSRGGNPVYSFNAAAGKSGSLPFYSGQNLSNASLTVCSNWTGTTESTFPGLCDPAATGSPPGSPYPTAGNEVELGLYALVKIPNVWSYGVAYSAEVDVNDQAPPQNVTMAPAAGSQNAHGWTDNAAVTLTASQPGLGIGSFSVENYGTNGTTIASQNLPCALPAESSAYPAGSSGFATCPQNSAQTLSLASLPEGSYTLRGHAQSLVGNDSASSPLPVKIDRSPPSLALSGTLYDHRTGTNGYHGLSGGSYNLTSSATDSWSGVASVTVAVDGQTKGTYTPPCSGTDGCGASYSFTFNTDGVADGNHTVTVTAKDQLGSDPIVGGNHTTVQSFTVTLSRNVTNLAPPSIGGIPEGGQTLSASTGWWAGGQPITYTYQWEDCDASGNACTNIPAATSDTYVLGPIDVGHTLRVAVTATNAEGFSSASSSPTTAVTSDPAPLRLDVSGRLHDVAGKLVSGSATLLVSSSDDPSVPVAYPTTITVMVDGQSVTSASQSTCVPAADPNSCELSVDSWALDTTNYPDGNHSVSVQAQDSVGDSASRTWQIHVSNSTPLLMPCTDPGANVNFPVYSVGQVFENLAEQPATRTCDTPDADQLQEGLARDNDVTIDYGTCTPSPSGPDDTSLPANCNPPLSIQTWPACERNAALYQDDPFGTPLPHTDLLVRGVPASWFDDGADRRLEIYTGLVTVVIFGDNDQLMLDAANAMLPVPGNPFSGTDLLSDAIDAEAYLPQAVLTALSGTLTCQ